MSRRSALIQTLTLLDLISIRCEAYSDADLVTIALGHPIVKGACIGCIDNFDFVLAAG